MLTRGLLLLSLLLTSLIASSAAHLSEQSPTAMFDCSGRVHLVGDGDEVPADSDQGVPHHHTGCHGHGTFSDAAHRADLIAPQSAAQPYFFSAHSFRKRWTAGPGLRPPIA